MDTSDAGLYAGLVRGALDASVEGWDFSWSAGRVVADDLSWDYRERAAEAVRRVLPETGRLLDVDTGGGEMLAGLAPLPTTIATEPHPPNVPIAAERLGPLGVDVLPGDAAALPVADAHVDLVLNRHGGLDAGEIARVLRPGGVFLTQQVGSRNDVEFNEALGAPPAAGETHDLGTAVAALEAAGMVVEDAVEEFPRVRYLDVGAVVRHLRAVPWQVPGFDVTTFDAPLRAIHAHIQRSGSFTVRDHRFLIRAGS